MSLNPEQLERNRRELQANRQLCPLDDQQLCAALGWTPEQLHANLSIGAGSEPGEIWRLRDFLEQVIRDTGGTPMPFTVLSDDKRAQSIVWFGARTIPPTPEVKS